MQQHEQLRTLPLYWRRMHRSGLWVFRRFKPGAAVLHLSKAATAAGRCGIHEYVAVVGVRPQPLHGHSR